MSTGHGFVDQGAHGGVLQQPVTTLAEPAADNYSRFTGTRQQVEARTPAEVLADIGAASTSHQATHMPGGSDLLKVLGFFNGTFLESFDAIATSNGTTITMSLEKSGTGDLTMVFSDGETLLDCTPALTIALTAGSDTAPQENFIYIPKSTKVLTKDTSAWPTAEHIKVAYFVVQSASFVQTEGALVNQNWNDHASDTSTSLGHLSHIAERIRAEAAVYHSGVAPTVTITTNAGVPDNVDLALSAGVIYQMHRHVFAALDTAGADNAHVVNDSVTPYDAITDLNVLLTDSAGGSMSNKYFNLVVWAVANKAGTHAPMMINLPSGSYNTQSGAQNDTDGHTNFTMPAAFSIDSSTGFLIARLLFRHQPASGGTWTLVETGDLRGLTPASAVGGGTSLSQTEFADNQFKVFDDSDSTKIMDFQLSGITTGNTRTITMADQDIDLTPGTGTYPAAADVLLKDGSVGLTGPWSAGHNITDVGLLEVDNIRLNSSTIENTLNNADLIIKSALAGTGDVKLIAGGSIVLDANDVRITPDADTDALITFVGTTNTGTLLYMEDEDEFRFDALVQGTQLKSTGTLQVDGVATITGLATGGLTDYDLKVGDTTTPDYGMIQIGNAVIGRTSYNVGAINLAGAMLYRNIGGPDTGDIEHIFTESTGNTCRFAIPKSGAGLATYNPRSFAIAGPAPADTDFVKLSYWQGQGIFHNLTFDTVADGAQLGVQGDIECESTLYIDTIAESTTAAGVTIDGVLLKDGVVGIGYGGTGQTTAQAAIDALSAVSGATNEHVLTKDTASGNAIWKVATGGGGGGDVTAAANMGDNEIVRGDGGAKGVQDSPGVTIDDSGNLAGLNSLTLADDKDLVFGATDAKLRWDTSQTRNQLVLGLVPAAAATSGVFSIMRLADIGHANRDPDSAQNYPRLRLWGEDPTDAEAWIEMSHPDGWGEIVWGSGPLRLGSLTGSADVQLVQGNLVLLQAGATVDGVDVSDDVVLTDGSNPLVANWDAGAFQIRALTFFSDATTGTAPFTVSSETMVENLNAEALDGNLASAFFLLAGRAGGQVAIGGTASGNNLTLQSTAHATKGKLLLGATGNYVFDEVNGRLGLGQSAPAATLHLEEAGTVKTNLDIMQIVNTVHGADMFDAGPPIAGTATSILFRQAYSGGTIIDMGRVQFATGDDWTSTASTQDGEFWIECVEQGVMTRKMRIQPAAGGGVVSFFSNAQFIREGANTSLVTFNYSNTANQGSLFSCRRARGTEASRLAVVDGDDIGDFQFFGYANGAHRRKAGVAAIVTGTVSGSTVPTSLFFQLSLAGSGNPVDVLEIDSSGDVTLSTAGVRLGFGGTSEYIEDLSGALAFGTGTTGRMVLSSGVLSLVNGASTYGSLRWDSSYVSLYNDASQRIRIGSLSTSFAGPVLIGTIGTPATSALLDLTSVTRALLLSRMTTTQRNAMTAVNGMVMYNTATNDYNFYRNGSWQKVTTWSAA